VNILTDAADANPGDGIADTDLVMAGQQISLRAAIEEANALGLTGPVTINIPLEGTITLSLGQLAISEDVTITGSGVDNLTIDGDELSRVFYVDAGVNVTIQDLTITGGDAGSGNGGGIYSEGDLTLDGVNIHHNTADEGAGVYFIGGSLAVSGSSVTHNVAAGAFGVGGGIYAYEADSLVIDSSTIALNEGVAVGGVTVYNTASQIINSTISSNTTTDGFGGGIFYFADSALPTELINSTITNNDAGSGAYGYGGGIYLEPAIGNVIEIEMHNSIVADNFNSGGSDDIYGNLDTSSSYNLVGNGDDTNLTHNNLGNKVGSLSTSVIDPLLAPLGNYGGPTQTHALLAGSDAIDAGSSTKASGASLTTDQRGNSRTYNITGVTDGADGNTDIGAYELIAPTVQASQEFYVDEDSDVDVDPDEDIPVGQVVATDDGTSLLSWTIVSGASTIFSINSSTGQITVNDNEDLNFESNDTYVLGITVSDGTYTSAPVNVTINVGDTIVDGTIIVNSTDDAIDASLPEDGVVDADRTTPGRQITLRAAIQEANAHTGPVTINLPEGNYVLDRAGLDKVYTTAPNYNDLDINADVTIVGDGSGLTIVDASGIADSVGEGDRRVFQIGSGAEVAISGLTITGGNVANNNGGGIYNAGDLTLNDVVVVGNTAEDSGGGIYSTGTLTVESSTIEDNEALEGDGGGIYSSGDLTLNLTTVVNNSAENSGGGILSDEGSLEIKSSTIHANDALVGGGARIYMDNSSIVRIDSSTFSANTAIDDLIDPAAGSGGGLYIMDSTGTNTAPVAKFINSTFSGNIAYHTGAFRVHTNADVDVVNCTITENVATISAGGIGVSGIGSIVTAHNTILAGNTSVDAPTQSDAVGTFASTSSFNLIGQTLSTVLNTTGASNYNIVIGSSDPLLGALAYNGGPTRTHLLLTGSQAIDAGDDDFADEYDLAFDQRGEDRIQLGDTSLTIDIGAVEMAFDEL
jgi:predicted outer membrane repeat protein